MLHEPIDKRSTVVELNWHEDNEDLILLNPTGLRYKPLYFILALDRHPVFARKLAAGRLTARDFLALELPYNEPATCFFTVLKGAVHCEVTTAGPGQHPVFFVTEPSGLACRNLQLKDYTIVVSR
jgi:hypothetical protein